MVEFDHERTHMPTTESIPTPAEKPLVEKLTFTGAEVNEILGGISDVTRWRMEQRGILRRIPGLGRPLYSRRHILELIDGKTGRAS